MANILMEALRELNKFDEGSKNWKQENDKKLKNFLKNLPDTGPITFIKLGSMSYKPYFSRGYNERTGLYGDSCADWHNGWGRPKLDYSRKFVILKNKDGEFILKISPNSFKSLQSKESSLKNKTYKNWNDLMSELNLEIWQLTDDNSIAWDDKEYSISPLGDCLIEYDPETKKQKEKFYRRGY